MDLETLIFDPCEGCDIKNVDIASQKRMINARNCVARSINMLHEVVEKFELAPSETLMVDACLDAKKEGQCKYFEVQE